MPVPKRKVSKSRRDMRSANKGITPQAVSACTNCNDPILPHRVCEGCGFYKGQKVKATKADRSVKRAEVKAAAKKEAAEPSTQSE